MQGAQRRPRRPVRSPCRRESSSGSSGAGSPGGRSSPRNDEPRDLLIFSCNPKACALPGLDDEAHAVQRAYPRDADVRQVRNLDPNELRQELRTRPPRAFMFIGHANIELEGQRTLAFTDRRRELVAVRPETLASMLGQFSPARGGPLELVFLNGCESEALGQAVRRAGIPHVVCWRTLVENGAARPFSEAFFSAYAQQGCDAAEAFEQVPGWPSLAMRHEPTNPKPNPSHTMAAHVHVIGAHVHVVAGKAGAGDDPAPGPPEWYARLRPQVRAARPGHGGGRRGGGARLAHEQPRGGHSAAARRPHCRG